MFRQKKEDSHSDPEKKYMDYDFEIIYLRELSVLDEMIKYLNESFIECENIIDYEDYEYDVEKQKEYIDFYQYNEIENLYCPFSR